MDLDQIEAEGDAVRRELLDAVNQDGKDARAFGRVLAGLADSEDEGTRLRALELYLRLNAATPGRRKQVKIQTDHRSLVLTLGAGQLAGGIDESKLAKLPPAARREAIAAMDRLKALTESATDGDDLAAHDPALVVGDVPQDGDGRD